MRFHMCLVTQDRRGSFGLGTAKGEEFQTTGLIVCLSCNLGVISTLIGFLNRETGH